MRLLPWPSLASHGRVASRAWRLPSERAAIIRQVEAAGAKGSRAIAAALNARGARTARGGDWHATTVRNLLAREG
jgi:hypothetical protein